MSNFVIVSNGMLLALIHCENHSQLFCDKFRENCEPDDADFLCWQATPFNHDNSETKKTFEDRSMWSVEHNLSEFYHYHFKWANSNSILLRNY